MFAERAALTFLIAYGLAGLPVLAMARGRLRGWTAALVLATASLSMIVVAVLFSVLLGTFSIALPLTLALCGVACAPLVRFRPRPCPEVRALIHLALGGLAILALLPPLIENAGRIASIWDAVVSWSPWALALSEGQLEDRMGHYPQGLSALGAVAYVLVGEPSQTLWARQMTAGFPVVTLIALAAAFGARQLVGLALSCAAVLVVVTRFDLLQPGYAFSFTADVMVLMGIVASLALVRVLLLDEGWRPRFDPSAAPLRERLATALILALGAALAANAKQTGAVMVGIAPAAALLLTTGPWRARWAFAIGTGLLCAGLGLFWYARLIPDLLAGAGSEPATNTAFLLEGVHQGRGLAARAVLAVRNAALLTGWGWLALLGAGCLISLRTEFGRLAFALGLLPTGLFFLFVTGYAVRNATPPLAFAIVLGGLGWHVAAEAVAARVPALAGPAARLRASLDAPLPLPVPSVPRRIVRPALGAGAALAALAVLLVPDDWLRRRAAAAELAQGGTLGWSAMNAVLEETMRGQPPGSVLLTNYVVADRLPQTAAFDVRVGGYDARAASALAATGAPVTIYALWYDRAPPAYQAYLGCLEATGAFVLVDHRDDTTKWKVLRRDPDAPWSGACAS